MLRQGDGSGSGSVSGAGLGIRPRQSSGACTSAAREQPSQVQFPDNVLKVSKMRAGRGAMRGAMRRAVSVGGGGWVGGTLKTVPAGR